MTNIMKLLSNIKILVEAGVLDDEFKAFSEDHPNVDSIAELNDIISDEISYWDE